MTSAMTLARRPTSFRSRAATAALALVAAAATVAPARLAFAQAPTAAAAASVPTLRVPARQPRLAVTLPKMPPTRTRCVFELIDAGRSADSDRAVLEWDPLSPGALQRSLVLKADRAYQVTCYADSARHALKADVDFAWNFKGLQASGGGWDLRFDGGANQEAVVGRVEARASREYVAQASASGGGKRQWNLRVYDKLEPLTGRALQSAPSAAWRGPGLLPEADARELFGVVAEVVAGRVRPKALERARRRLIDALRCESSNANANANGAGREFERTCSILKVTKLEAAAASGEELLGALLADVADSAARRAASSRPHLRRALSLAAELAAEAARDRPERYLNGGSRLLLELARVRWPLDGAAGSTDRTLALQLALAAVAECSDSDACDDARVARMLHAPAEFMALRLDDIGASADLGRSGGLLGAWPEGPAFVASGLRVLSPPASMAQAEQAKAAVDMLVWAIELVEQGASSGPGSDLERLRQVLDACLDKDAATALSAAAAQPRGDRESKPERMLSTLGAFLRSSTAGRAPGEDERRARREARKQALEAAINAQLARGNRPGEPIFSLGSALGTSAGYSTVYPGGAAPHYGSVTVEPLVATLGVAFDVHSAGGLGLHAQLAPFNLGGYFIGRKSRGSDDISDGFGAVRNTALDFIMPTAILGLTYVGAESDIMFLGGATASYLPKIEGNKRASYEESLYLGLMLGAYLPILDFN